MVAGKRPVVAANMQHSIVALAELVIFVNSGANLK